MKVCNRCGIEINTVDGDNLCQDCKHCKTLRTKANRKARESALESCGLVKVKGALGGTYWE
jgi:hypothetical protein